MEIIMVWTNFVLLESVYPCTVNNVNIREVIVYFKHCIIDIISRKLIAIPRMANWKKYIYK